MRTHTRLALMIGAAALVGCGGSSTGPPPSSVVGTWQIAKMEYVSKANSAKKVDLIAQGGSGTVEFRSDHSYTLTVHNPDITWNGTWSVSDVLTLTIQGMQGQMQFDANLSGNTFTLTGADAPWDFGTGMEDAKLGLTLSK